jgi:hypothetical protein
MPTRNLPPLPDLQQYKKHAKDLVKAHAAGDPNAQRRVAEHHPRAAALSETARGVRLKLTDAQLVIAREHGFESWPKFARHVER